MSPDGLAYDFVLRKGVKFHNGETLTAEDVKFSRQRDRGASAKALRDNVAAVDTCILGRVRIRLKRPWPDFMTFYIGATGAAWIVPKKYVEKVGDEGFKKAPVGAGPVPIRVVHPGGGGGPGGLRSVLEESTEREAGDPEIDPRRDHAPRRAEAR